MAKRKKTITTKNSVAKTKGKKTTKQLVSISKTKIKKAAPTKNPIVATKRKKITKATASTIKKKSVKKAKRATNIMLHDVSAIPQKACLSGVWVPIKSVNDHVNIDETLGSVVLEDTSCDVTASDVGIITWVRPSQTRVNFDKAVCLIEPDPGSAAPDA